MRYTAKGINASNMLVKRKAIQIGLQSHYEKVKQESLAIAKTTARCTQYMGALKSF